MFLALGFGSGLLPRAPGTWGTVVGLVLYVALMPLDFAVLVGITIAVAAVGIPVCGIAADRLGVHDHPAIVWDEIAGILVALLFVPADWLWLLATFVAFRFFDVLKPWPIRWLDRRVGGGLGIILDDLVAGLAAGITLYFIGVLIAG